MAEIVQRFMDGTNLALSTKVFTDADLLIPAPDGWYTDGITTRYQTAGVLGNSQDCPDCFSPCDVQDQAFPRTWDFPVGAVPSATIYTAQSGTYNIPFSTGNTPGSEGAIIWRVYLKNYPSNPSADYSSPWGMIATLRQSGNITTTTNNFSSSGTTSVSPSLVGSGIPVVNGPAGTVGSTKRINNTPLTDDTKAVYVGRKNAAAGAGPMSTAYPAGWLITPATCQPGVLVPNNTPYGSGTILSPVTRLNYPNYWFHWPSEDFYLGGTNQFPNESPTESFSVYPEQVQIGPSTDATTGAGYRGWLTAVIPKTSALEDKSVLTLENPQCENGAVVSVLCPVKLDPIQVSPPGNTLGEICGVSTLNNVIYNVPGCSGLSQNQGPNVIFEFGVPNLGDIMCSGPNGEPLTAAQKDKFYKYNEAGTPKAFFVDQDSIVSQTSLSCMGGDAEFDTSYILEETGIGGGVYRTSYTIPVGATGACVVRVLTGDNPKGLIVSHFDTNANILGKTNLFSVRGAGADNFINETAYLAYFELSLVGALAITSGPVWGGNALKMGQKNADGTSPYVPLTIENIDNWPSMIGAQKAILDEEWECSSPDNPAYPCYINCQGTYEDNILVADNPVYIGKADFSGSAIPCTQDNSGEEIIDCNAGFSPASGGSENYVNVESVINLPPNGNHTGTLWQDIMPSQPNNSYGVAESYNIMTGYCSLYPNELDSTTWFLDEAELAQRFPSDTTDCSECMYTLRTLSPITSTWADVYDLRRIYITPSQVQLYKPSSLYASCTPGWSMAVIPLTGTLTATETIELDVYVPSSNASFQVYMDTPAALPAFASPAAADANLYGPYPLTETSASSNIGTMCVAGQGSGTIATCFIAHNAFGGTSGPCIPGNANIAGTPCDGQLAITHVPRFNDMVFSDANGATKLPAGRYYYNEAAALPDTSGNRIIEVDDFGIVTCVSRCYTAGAYITGLCDIW
jgi:hypothetical protein